MRILNITAVDNRGQRFSGAELKTALHQLGHESSLAVKYRAGQDQSTVALYNPILHRIDKHIMQRLERIFSLQSILPISAYPLYFMLVYRNADVVHLHLVHLREFFSLFHVLIMSRQRPLVWSLHDPWLLSGHCVHSFECERWQTGCGHCPDLTIPLPIRHDTTALMWRLKHFVMHRSKVTLVVASEWMRERVNCSPVLSHLPCQVIPYGIDLNVFQPRDKVKSRERFGIPADAHVLAFRHTPRTPFKGWPWLHKALMMLEPERPTYLLTIDGTDGLDDLAGKYQFVKLGWVEDEDILVDVLNAADIFLMPSIAEAFGLMAVEAMACRTPVIVFEGTALPSVIHAPQAGIAVPYKDHKALAQAIELLLKDSNLRENLGVEGQRIAQENYNNALYVQRHVELYEALIEANRQPPFSPQPSA